MTDFSSYEAKPTESQSSSSGRNPAYTAISYIILAIVGLSTAGENETISYYIGAIAGSILMLSAIGWLLTRWPRKLRPHWPAAAVIVGLLVSWGNASEPAHKDFKDERARAIGELDSIVQANRELMNGNSTGTTPYVRGNGVQESPVDTTAALLRSTSHAFRGLEALASGLRDKHGIDDEPPNAWLTNSYYVSASTYPEVRRHFDRQRDFTLEFADSLHSENYWYSEFEAALLEEGVSDERLLREVLDGYQQTLPSQDTMVQMTIAFAETAIEFHDSLVSMETNIRANGAGEIRFQGLSQHEIGTLTNLEEQVMALARQIVSRQALGLDRMESMVRSVR